MRYNPESPSAQAAVSLSVLSHSVALDAVVDRYNRDSIFINGFINFPGDRAYSHVISRALKTHGPSVCHGRCAYRTVMGEKRASFDLSLLQYMTVCQVARNCDSVIHSVI